MISAQTDQVAQEHLIERYMLLPNQVWDGIINQATQNVEVLKDGDAVKQLGNILKTNVRACKALGHPYVVQVRRKMYCKKSRFLEHLIYNVFMILAYLIDVPSANLTMRNSFNRFKINKTGKSR